jgi:NAD(P)-dependent dehydrogenase (short-subunit alcohol dehydrogenase family)
MIQDKLHGARIVIIGGSSGIGFSVARLSLAAGAAKVIIGSSSQERVDAAVQKLNAEFQNASGKIRGIAVDAKDTDQIKSFFDSIGQFDHLVRHPTE